MTVTRRDTGAAPVSIFCNQRLACTTAMKCVSGGWWWPRGFTVQGAISKLPSFVLQESSVVTEDFPMITNVRLVGICITLMGASAWGNFPMSGLTQHSYIDLYSFPSSPTKVLALSHDRLFSSVLEAPWSLRQQRHVNMPPYAVAIMLIFHIKKICERDRNTAKISNFVFCLRL